MDTRKKLAALSCAAMLASALPALAWADEAAEPTADGGAAPGAGQVAEQPAEGDGGAASAVEAQPRSIGPRQMDVLGDRSEMYGETRASRFGIIATTEWIDDSLRNVPTYRIEAKQATRKIDFVIVPTGEYAECAKIEVHVKPSAGSAGAPKTFEVTRPSKEATFDFTSEIFNLGDQTGDDAYDADFLVAFVPLEGAFAEPDADAPEAGADTGATSPKTGLGAASVAGASCGMLAAAGALALALRRRHAK